MHGAWLTGLGLVRYLGRCWYWSEAGWGALGEPPSPLHNGDCAAMPPSFWAHGSLGAAQGTVFALEGEGCSTDRGSPGPGHRPTPAIWSDGPDNVDLDAAGGTLLARAGVESLVPPREDVLAATGWRATTPIAPTPRSSHRRRVVPQPDVLQRRAAATSLQRHV